MNPELSFGFARRHGILLDRQAAEPAVLMRDSASLQVLSEVLRVTGSHWPLRLVDEGHFAERLAACYGGTQDAAHTVIQGLDEQIDLPRLAQALPQSCDLLDQ